MMITILGFPPKTKYQDVKILIKQECNINDFILDNLVNDSAAVGTKKVRVGLTDNSEGYKVMKCLDGYQMPGNYVLKAIPVGKAATTLPPQGAFDTHIGYQDHSRNDYNTAPRNDYVGHSNNYNSQNPHGSGMHGSAPHVGRPTQGPGGHSGPMDVNRPSPWASGTTSNQWGAGPPMASQVPQNTFGGFSSPQGNINNPYGQQHHQNPVQSRSDVRPGFNQPRTHTEQTYGGYPPKANIPEVPPRQEVRHALRSIETVDTGSVSRAPMHGRYPSQSYQQEKSVTIMKDNFQGPTQYNISNPGAQTSSSGQQYPMSAPSASPWQSQEYEKRHGHSPRREVISHGGRSVERRPSPSGRRVSPPARRISPHARKFSPTGKRPSPGRRDSPHKRPSPMRRLVSPSRRTSPGRRPTLGRRDSPQRMNRYSPDRHHSDKLDKFGPDKLKQVRPAYEPTSHASNQDMYSGGYRSDARESVQYPMQGGRQGQRISPWQRDEPVAMKKQDDERRDITRMQMSRDRIPDVAVDPKHSITPQRKSRSPRSSPEIRDAPPPPSWPGQKGREPDSFTRTTRTFLRESKPRVPNMFQYGSDHSEKTKMCENDILTTASEDHSSKIKFDPPRRCQRENQYRTPVTVSASYKGNRNSLHEMILKQTAVMLIVGESLQLNVNLTFKGKITNNLEDRGSMRNACTQMNTIAVESRHLAMILEKLMLLIQISIKILKTSTRELCSSKRKQKNCVGWVLRKGMIMRRMKQGATTVKENAKRDLSGTGGETTPRDDRPRDDRPRDDRPRDDRPRDDRPRDDRPRDDRPRDDRPRDDRMREDRSRDDRPRDDRPRYDTRPDDMRRPEFRPREEYSKQPEREQDRRFTVNPAIRMKRDKAIEEICTKLLDRHEHYRPAKEEHRARVMEELQLAIARIVFDMFGDNDVSFIEIIIKFQAKYTYKDEEKLLLDVMSSLPSHYRVAKRQAPESTEVPAKTARPDPSPNLKSEKRPVLSPKKQRPLQTVLKRKPEQLPKLEQKPSSSEPKVARVPAKNVPETSTTSAKKLDVKKVEEEKKPATLPTPVETPVQSAGHYELNDRMTNMVETELRNIMIKVWQELPDNPMDEAEALVVDKLRNAAGDDLRNVLGLNITKRLLNVHNPLYVKVQFSGKPEKQQLGDFLKRYNFIAFKRIEKTVNMFAAQVKTISDFDRICSDKDVRCGGVKVTINPIYKFTKCPPNLISSFYNEDDNAGDEAEVNEKDDKSEVKTDKGKPTQSIASDPSKLNINKDENNENITKVDKTDNKTDGNSATSKPVATKVLNEKPAVNKADSENPAENKAANEKSVINKADSEKSTQKTVTKVPVENKPSVNNDKVANKPTVVNTPAEKKQTVENKTANKTVPPVKNVAKPVEITNKVAKKHKTSNVESDNDELDDHDIFALLSEGIVLDECSGSDEE
ncbi:hypothetical protein HW555_011593 [Spodoptera exigua]|uniref:Uncharacterized protein n=1 Tax=Spodoptera exigua TaxID=7107 RepID=A0A835G8A4_SPOEX|nr:hypothetical protein HW555_011593 [Spodoptera exigua]